MKGLHGSDDQGEVSIVSFRHIRPGAKWTHVIANNGLTTDGSRLDRQTSKLNVSATQFQYSALIDTTIRATTYKELDSETGLARIVSAVSTDTGMTFGRHRSFDAADLAKLGAGTFDKDAVFAVSQCLYEDRTGEVYVDVLVGEGTSMRYARLPIGVNAEAVRKELADQKQAMLAK